MNQGIEGGILVGSEGAVQKVVDFGSGAMNKNGT